MSVCAQCNQFQINKSYININKISNMQRKKIHDVKVKNPMPDHELLLWEEWIKIRNDETTKLAERLHKTQAGLAMNLLENKREELEWKTALEHAQIEKKPYMRGGPWELPLRLKQDCYCAPVYEVQRTAVELGKPRVVEHISIPEYIQKEEKGLKGEPHRIICEHLDSEFKKYRSKREADLKEKLVKLDPFRPKASGLIIKGSQPKIPPPKMPPLPTITMTPVVSIAHVTGAVYAVKINNTVVYKDLSGHSSYQLEQLKRQPWFEKCTTWSYYFNTPIKRAGRCKVHLENLGTVALKYCWKKIKKPIPYIPEDTYEQVFFFNKNEDVLSPGQCKELCFTFLSDKPGIFSESWELSFSNINFFDSLTERFVVNLSGDSVEKADSIRKKCDILKSRIAKKAITNIARDIINDAIIKATAVKPQQYPYKHLFLEAEIFKMKNPVCFYHQTEVMNMKDLYSEMLPGKEWDLSIKSWREAMMSKDYEDRMKYYELLRHSHSELLKPWYEGEPLLQKKYRAMKTILGQMANLFDRKYDELLDCFAPLNLEEDKVESNNVSTIRMSSLDPCTCQKISNLFHLYAYEYFAEAIEMCAGILSSLELNRWIEFDFCQW